MRGGVEATLFHQATDANVECSLALVADLIAQRKQRRELGVHLSGRVAAQARYIARRLKPAEPRVPELDLAQGFFAGGAQVMLRAVVGDEQDLEARAHRGRGQEEGANFKFEI